MGAFVSPNMINLKIISFCVAFAIVYLHRLFFITPTSNLSGLSSFHFSRSHTDNLSIPFFFPFLISVHSDFHLSHSRQLAPNSCEALGNVRVKFQLEVNWTGFCRYLSYSSRIYQYTRVYSICLLLCTIDIHYVVHLMCSELAVCRTFRGSNALTCMCVSSLLATGVKFVSIVQCVLL